MPSANVPTLELAEDGVNSYPSDDLIVTYRFLATSVPEYVPIKELD